MEKINLSTATKNLIKHFPLLLSTGAALCIFLSPTPLFLLMTAAVFVAVAVVALLDRVKPPAISNKLPRLASILVTLLTLITGYTTFIARWTPSNSAGALASKLHLSTPVLLVIVGVVGCGIGLYAMHVLSCWIVTWVTQMFKECLPVHEKPEIVANLKRNWYFPISAMAFFGLFSSLSLDYFLGLLIAFLASAVVASQFSSLLSAAKGNQKWLHILAIMTALGVCFRGWGAFCKTWGLSTNILGSAPVPADIYGIISGFLAVVGVLFVYFCVLAFWKKLASIIADSQLFADVKIPERIVYGILLMATMALMVFSFTKTNAFYGTTHICDIIYTSDSPYLVKENAYLVLTHTENDIRQPFFALFAAPFVGAPYLLGKLLGASGSVQVILMNAVQVIMLFAANFMLAKVMRLNPIKRICFLLLTSCTYTYLLFTLMMEQYIIAYFWLILCIYLIFEKQRPEKFALLGAGGTLVTSMVLLPFMSDKHPVRNFKAWFADMFHSVLEFIGVMLIFCRFDVIYGFTTRISRLNQYTGKDLTFADKLRQYISFVGNCFVAPDAGMNTTLFPYISWQLDPVSAISFIGIAVLLLVTVSAILNKDKKISLLAAGWAAFSVVMLLGLGWGTQENGLILYALYFGWAFLVLLFQLVEKIEDKLKIQFLVPVVSIGCAIALTVINIPAIMEMVNFAIAFYPA